MYDSRQYPNDHAHRDPHSYIQVLYNIHSPLIHFLKLYKVDTSPNFRFKIIQGL